MKQYNEKPSKLTNLGEDVLGASRHHFDTYENPEAKATKERAKALKNGLSELKNNTQRDLNQDNFKAKIRFYEFNKTILKIPSYTGPKEGTKEDMKELRTHIVTTLKGSEYDECGKAYNRLARVLSKVEYYVRSLEDALEYFAPKKAVNSFKEMNGVRAVWDMDTSISQETIDYLRSTVRAVQYGNSLTEKERTYCAQNLAESLIVLNKYFPLPLKELAFSFGARGKAGSVAHYEPKSNVLAFNRGIDGAFIHELGHAIDYKLGKISEKMPWEYRSKYQDKLRAAKVSSNDMKYYRKPTEIFARLFEVYCRKNISELSAFMQVTYNQDVMPELNEEIENWMKETLEKLKEV